MTMKFLFLERCGIVLKILKYSCSPAVDRARIEIFTRFIRKETTVSEEEYNRHILGVLSCIQHTPR